eukprot:gene48469-63577_t
MVITLPSAWDAAFGLKVAARMAWVGEASPLLLGDGAPRPR